MKKALVLGATGGIGYAIVRELIARDISVIAFARGKEKLKLFYDHEPKVEVFVGDALIEADVERAVHGVDVIFHAVSFPYPVWTDTHPLCMEIMIQVAEQNQAKIAFIDNIYAYGKKTNMLVTEDMEKNPHTKKGKIRLEMENRLKESSVPTLIVHMPDLYGPNAGNTILHETLKSVAQNKTANFVGKTNVRKEYLYTFDGAKAVVELALRDDAYNQNWNIPAVHPITGEEIIQIIREEQGYTKSFRTITKGMIWFLGFFQPFMKEMVEMMYLTESPVILSGQKYETLIGKVPRTPYNEGINETLKWMKEKS